MIFNLFKSKPTLKELIPNGFVDIHSHILPGIDDGAKNIEESLSLISKMKEIGFSKIIGTPHTYPGLYNNTSDSIKKSYEKLKKNISEDINIDYASEYMLDNSIVEKAEKKELLCLNDKFILTEISFLSAPVNFYEIIFNLTINGYKVILAHPERYLYYLDNIKKLEEIKRRGVFFQANLLSFTGYYGVDVTKFLNKLLKLKMIDFIGSDFHNISQIEYIKNSQKGLNYRNAKIVEGIFENNQIFK